MGHSKPNHIKEVSSFGVYHHAHCMQNMGVISVSSTQPYATLSASMVRKPSTMHRISTGDLADTRICTDAPSKLGSICVVAGQDCQLCPRVSNRPFGCLSAALKLAVVFTMTVKIASNMHSKTSCSLHQPSLIAYCITMFL